MRKLAIVVSLTALLTGAAAAQSVDSDAMVARMEAVQAQAEADAVRPGDEALTCEQLQVEYMATFDSPEMDAFTASSSTYAAEQQERMAEAQADMQNQMAGNIAMGIASAFIPGLGFAQQAMMMSQMEEQQRRADESMAGMDVMMTSTGAAMPVMYRAKRVQELAQAQNCAFLQEMMNAAPPEGVEE